MYPTLNAAYMQLLMRRILFQLWRSMLAKLCTGKPKPVCYWPRGKYYPIFTITIFSAFFRTMSIPVTLRAVIRRWRTMKVKAEPLNQDHIRVNSSYFGNDSSLQQIPDVSCGAESERLQNQQQSQPPTQQLPGIVMNMNMKPRVSQNSSFTISPINATNPFPSQQPQQPMDMMSTYMNNPLFSSLSNFQQNMGGLNLQNFTPNMALQMMAASQMQGGKASPSMLMGLLDQVGQRGKRKKRKGTSEDNGNGTGKLLLAVYPNNSSAFA